jgi:hypothetical protein
MAGLKKQHFKPVVLVIVGIAGIFNLVFYFGPYRTQHRYADRNTEIAHGVSGYLDELPGQWNAFFYAPPVMFANFPTIDYLLAEDEGRIELVDVSEPATLPVVAEDASSVYIFIPERSQEIETIQQAMPNGRLRTFPGYHANPLFFAYEVERNS